MTSRDEELAEILEMINDVRKTAPLVNATMDSVVKLIKGELDRKSGRQTGPAKGQKYWFASTYYTNSYIYKADTIDLDICTNISIYPEERFAEAELRAKKLIRDVNKRRRELNEGKEFGERKYCIMLGVSSGVVVWKSSDQAYVRGDAYPFGLFKDIADCKMCINEFDEDLEWFYHEYIPLMEELDEYDWAKAPGWGEED